MWFDAEPTSGPAKPSPVLATAGFGRKSAKCDLLFPRARRSVDRSQHSALPYLHTWCLLTISCSSCNTFWTIVNPPQGNPGGSDQA